MYHLNRFIRAPGVGCGHGATVTGTIHNNSLTKKTTNMKTKIFAGCLLAAVMTGTYSEAQIIGPGTTTPTTSTTFMTPKQSFTYLWDFGPVSVLPFAMPPLTPLIGPGSLNPAPLNTPSYGCFVQSHPGNNTSLPGNYYYFQTEYNTGNIICYNYGTTFPPTATITPTYSVTVPGNVQLEGIDIVQDGADHWYGVAVNSNNLIQLWFNNGLGNPPMMTVTPIAVPLLAWPHQVTIVDDRAGGTGYHAFVANRNSTITRFDFGPTVASLFAPPTGVVPLPNAGGVGNPCNFTMYQEKGWHMLITSLISGNISRYDFGASIMNPAPPGVLLPGFGGLTNLPRSIGIFPDCRGNLAAFIFNETGNLIQANFPGGSIMNPPVYANLGPIGSFTNGSCASALYSDATGNNPHFAYIVSNFGPGTIKLLDPFIPLNPADAAHEYMQLSQNHLFPASGGYPISLFYDMGRYSGPSVACAGIQVNTVAPCYDASLSSMTITPDPNYPCTFTACENVTTSNSITHYTWEVEPGNIVVDDPNTTSTDCFTFSIAFGTTYTVTATAHIVDANNDCCEAIFTQTVTCGDAASTPLMPVHSTDGVNSVNTATHDGFSIFPNPTDNIVTITSTDQDVLLVRVIDVNGRKVAEYNYKEEEKVKNAKISLQGLPAGTYYLNVNNKSSKVVVKNE